MIDTHEIQLEKIKLALTETLSNELLNVIVDTCEMNGDFINNLTTLRIRGYLWGESGETRTISYPLTWWDAFKVRWFPRWLLAKYPANYQHHEITLKTLYPHFRISMPNETFVLKYQVHDYSDLSAS